MRANRPDSRYYGDRRSIQDRDGAVQLALVAYSGVCPLDHQAAGQNSESSGIVAAFDDVSSKVDAHASTSARPNSSGSRARQAQYLSGLLRIDWESMIAAVGIGPRPWATRIRSRNVSLMRCHAPAVTQRR
jgi:hypothetical protein